MVYLLVARLPQTFKNEKGLTAIALNILAARLNPQPAREYRRTSVDPHFPHLPAVPARLGMRIQTLLPSSHASTSSGINRTNRAESRRILSLPRATSSSTNRRVQPMYSHSSSLENGRSDRRLPGLCSD